VAPEEPILISSEHLDLRVDFERGMSVWPRVTLALLASHLALFAVEAARGSLESAAALLDLGALEAGALARGEPWRLWSATFLHGSVDHLLGNALALYVTGMACEHGFGRIQFVGLYVTSGLAGSLLSLAGLEPGVPAVGASGAIFGLMGASAVLFLRHGRRLIIRDRRTGVVMAAWILYSVGLGLLTPFVDNRAHLGGLLGGVSVSLLLHARVLAPGGALPARAWVLFWPSAAAGLLLSALWLRRLL
jgi:rhomboid protease GluP